MDRRSFLQGMAALGIASPLAAFSAQPAGALSRLPATAWSLGFMTMNHDELNAADLAVEGTLPKALRGVFYRNGPARHERGGLRYRHWFDGDGMVHAYRFTDEGISHRARYVHTEKYLDEESAGKFTRAAYGTVFPGVAPPLGADSINVANISVLYHGQELLALWEGGSAYRLDADSLDTLGKKTWRKDLAGLPFSAHPKLEPDGSLWNFGTAQRSNQLLLYRISAQGEMQKADAIPVPDLPMIHDFAITQRHLVFLLPPFRLDGERLADGKSMAESYVWEPRKGMRVLMIEKDDWSRRRMVETNSGFLFHIANAWEDRQGVIRLSYMRADNDAAFRRGFDVMQGTYTYEPGARLCMMTIDPVTGKISQEHMPEEAEFPSVDSRHVGRRYRQIVTLARSPSKATFGFDLVQRRDLESGTVDRYRYGPDFLAEEHILIPDLSRDTEGSGWVVGTALDLKRKATLLSVFDAQALHNGPLARAYLPYALPLGLHGAFRRLPA